MSVSKLVFSIFCFSVPGLIAGCTPNALRAPTTSAFFKQQSFTRPNKSKSTQAFTFLIGLKPYLGRGTSDLKPAEELHLKSAGKSLVLTDSLGVHHESSKIILSWRTLPLLNPQTLQRQVAGPFASFESAQRLAERLQNKGISVEIAHPKDWEVWIPQGVNVPKGINVLPWKKTIKSEIKPVLKGASGEIILSGPLKIVAPDGLYFNEGLYLGPFWLKADAYGSWTFVEEVPLERYLKGVVPHEIGPNAPEEAQAAQAVLARTWALANSKRFAIDGYHLCSDTQCQVYKDPEKASQSVRSAIAKTSGNYLSWDKKPIHAVYHASNGGVMASGSEAWSISPVPYLRAQLDGSKKWQDRFILPLKKSSTLRVLLKEEDGAYGAKHPRFRWVRTLTAEQLKNALDLFASSNTLPSGVKVLERGPSGRVIALEIFHENKQLKRVLKLDEIRRVLRSLPSTLFVVEELKEGLWQFSGGGFGHGAGLSQAGAIDLALRGWKVPQILRHYYPETRYGTLQDLPKNP